MKITFATPMPPDPTGIADYSAVLVEALRERKPGWTIEVLASKDTLSDEESLFVHHVGNSSFHDFVYPLIFRHPDVLVLHDLVLHHARLLHYLESPEVRAYREDLASTEKRARALAELEAYRHEVAEAYPEAGETVASIAIRMGGGRLLYDYPLYEHLVKACRLTLVHSESARDEVRARCPEASVRRIRMGVALPTPVDKSEARRKLGLKDGLMLASFGLVTPEKRIVTALRALKRLRDRGIAARYALVGGGVAHFDPLVEARRLDIEDAVTLTGRVSEEELLLYAFASDLCLNLRYPSAGETSAMLLRLLACGRPVVVTDQIAMLELPETVVARSSLEGEEDGLYCDLMDLMGDEGRLAELGAAARDFVNREHSPDAMVSDYVEALESLETL